MDASYINRVIEEKRDLVGKINKLGPFVKSGLYDKLDADEQLRLTKQLKVMNEYLNILRERIAAYNSTLNG